MSRDEGTLETQTIRANECQGVVNRHVERRDKRVTVQAPQRNNKQPECHTGGYHPLGGGAYGLLGH